MRPQVGKRARLYKPPKEIPKTRTRLFVESRVKQNLSINHEFLYYSDVKTAVNMNALEQRIITKQSTIKLIDRGYTIERLKKALEEEIHIDSHRLNKYY